MEFLEERTKPFAGGLNPEIELIRTQTIMEGADLCDFRFVKRRRLE